MNPVKIENPVKIKNLVEIKNPVEIESITPLFAKKKVTILITDSGLGGLSIFAWIAARFKRDPIFSQVSLIYYNAWPQQDRGYHRLKDTAERVRVFDRALAGMKRFRPDMILIACNTLSVLYNRTEFSRLETPPVIDIVGFGVDMVFENLTEKTDATAVILGTVTTIASDAHRSRLIEKGISPHRLIVQSCDQLATQIEKGPTNDSVVRLVEKFAGQAVEKLGHGRSRLFAALFCTHFGYAQGLIREKLEYLTGRRVSILDPNRRMAAFLFEASSGRRYERTVLDMRVVSRIVWEQTKIDVISGIIEKQSVETAEALRDYEQIPDLFTL